MLSQIGHWAFYATCDYKSNHQFPVLDTCIIGFNKAEQIELNLIKEGRMTEIDVWISLEPIRILTLVYDIDADTRYECYNWR